MVADETLWLVAFWLVIGIATIVSLVAAVVIAHDLFTVPPDPPRSEIRHRLDRLATDDEARAVATHVVIRRRGAFEQLAKK
jgi:hypothetical protein